MIEINKLIIYFCERLEPHPPISPLDWHDVCLSTLSYLNTHRVTTLMLSSLAGNTADLETEKRLNQCGGA
ncbi:unnamed protein product [marine sediment metagenome]|uniref:Uncharacterized protein n=1 Tax=marine sediment metagenome TaxID=412755 RepID=X1UQ96_9ZZZZ